MCTLSLSDTIRTPAFIHPYPGRMMLGVRQDFPQVEAQSNLVSPDAAVRTAGLNDARVCHPGRGVTGDVEDAAAVDRETVRHRSRATSETNHTVREPCCEVMTHSGSEEKLHRRRTVVTRRSTLRSMVCGAVQLGCSFVTMRVRS